MLNPSLNILELPPSFPPSLSPSLPPSLSRSLPLSLPPSLSSSLAHSLIHPLTHSLTHSLTNSLTHLRLDSGLYLAYLAYLYKCITSFKSVTLEKCQLWDLWQLLSASDDLRFCKHLCINVLLGTRVFRKTKTRTISKLAQKVVHQSFLLISKPKS